MRFLIFGITVCIVGGIAAILGLFSYVFFGIWNFICGVFWWVIDLIRSIWNGICGILEWIWDGICYLFLAAVDYLIIPVFAFCLSLVTCSDGQPQQDSTPQALTESVLKEAPFSYEMPSGEYSNIPTEEMRLILQKQTETLQNMITAARGRNMPTMPGRIDSEKDLLQLVLSLTHEEWQLLKVRQLLRAIGMTNAQLPPYPTEEAIMNALFYGDFPYRACHLIDTLMFKNDVDYGTIKPPCAQMRYLAAYTLGLMATQHYKTLHKKHWLYTVRRYHHLETLNTSKLKEICFRHPSAGVLDAEKEAGFFIGFFARRSELSLFYQNNEWLKDPKTTPLTTLSDFKKKCDTMPEKFRVKPLMDFDGEFPEWKELDTYNGETAEQLIQYLRAHPELKLYTNQTVREFTLRAARCGHTALLKELIEHGTGLIPPECLDAADHSPELQEYLDEKGAW